MTLLTGEHDIVYVVKPGEANEPLRWSLRMLAANVPHRRVWCAGWRPTWVSSEVGHVATVQEGNVFDNSTRNLEAAAHHPEVSDTFLYFNDDFFVTKPITALPVMHRGAMRELAAELIRKWGRPYAYYNGLVATMKLLEELGHPEPLCYEVHTPMAMEKDKLVETINVGFEVRPLFKRSLYGNLWHPSVGERIDDPKIAFGQAPSTGIPEPFVSTAMRSWNGITGQRLRQMWPDPGPYEKA